MRKLSKSFLILSLLFLSTSPTFAEEVKIEGNGVYKVYEKETNTPVEVKNNIFNADKEKSYIVKDEKNVDEDLVIDKDLVTEGLVVRPKKKTVKPPKKVIDIEKTGDNIMLVIGATALLVLGSVLLLVNNIFRKGRKSDEK